MQTRKVSSLLGVDLSNGVDNTAKCYGYRNKDGSLNITKIKIIKCSVTAAERGVEMIKLKYNEQKGITLVELLIVITVIAILATIASPSFSRMRAKFYLREAAGTITGQIQLLKATALSQSGVSYVLVINEANNSYMIRKNGINGEEIRLSDGRNRNPFIFEIRQNGNTPITTAEISFLNRGILSNRGEIEIGNSYGDIAIVRYTLFGRVFTEFK